MTKVCKNCKYYSPPENKHEKEQNYGICNSPKFIYLQMKDRKIDDELVYEGYAAFFYVRPDFGCIYWEKKKR